MKNNQDTQKKVCVLAYQYGAENAGDFAITLGAIDLLLQQYDKIIVVSKFTEKQKQYQDAQLYFKRIYGNKVELIRGPFLLDRSRKTALLKSYMMGLIRMFSSRMFRYYSDIFKTADALYVNGGNLLRCNSLTDLIRLFALLYPAIVAKKIKLPYVFLPQSTTVVDKKGEWLLNKVLPDAGTVLIREEISYQYLSQRLEGVNWKNSMDMAFFIQENEKAQKEFQEKYETMKFWSNRPIAITLRKEKIGDIGELDQDTITTIRKNILQLIETCFHNGKSVVIVAQTAKDAAFSKDIYNSLLKEAPQNSLYFIEEHDPLLLREVYKNVELLVGMRLHSIILASSVGTPTIGFFAEEWGKKNPGIMQKIHMPYTYLNDDIQWENMISASLNAAETMREIIRNEKDGILEIIKNS